jgi:hypothetical protein
VLCGIPQNRVGQFNAVLGVTDLDDYMELPLSDLKSDFETVSKNPAYAQAVSIRSAKKCIALRAWGEYMLLRNQQFDAADFDQQTHDRFLQYVVWLGKIDKEMELYRKATMTTTLKSSAEWLKFERQVNTKLQTYRSLVMKHSLRYVIRPHTDVNDEMLGEDYPTLDADLYMTAQLEGPQFESDNKRFMELLTFIRRFATTKNGRAAWLALKGQMEGPAAIDARKKKGHADLDTAFYTGKSKNYTWDDYIRVRQEAHLELELLEAPVNEMRKVDLMFEGVKAEALSPVILALKANGDYANDFDGAQQQIKKATNQMVSKRVRQLRSVRSLPSEPDPAATTRVVAEGVTASVRVAGAAAGATRSRKARERAAKPASSQSNPSSPLETIPIWKSTQVFTHRKCIAHCPRSSRGRSRPYARKRRRTRRTIPALEPWSSSSLQRPLNSATGRPKTPRKAQVPTSRPKRVIPRRLLTTRALLRMTRTASLPWRTRNRRPYLLVVPRMQRSQRPSKPKSWRLWRSPPSLWQSLSPTHGDLEKAGRCLQKGASVGPAVPRKKKTRRYSSGRITLIGVSMRRTARKGIIAFSLTAWSRVIIWIIAPVLARSP